MSKNTKDLRVDLCAPLRISDYGAAVLLMMLAAGVFWRFVSGGTAQPTNPIILFIWVDDQGDCDLGGDGATEVETPRIDELAENGGRFADDYAAVCIGKCHVGFVTMEGLSKRKHPDALTTEILTLSPMNIFYRIIDEAFFL